MRALARRPTTLERWPKGVHPGIVLSTREKGGGDAFFQKRIPRGAPDYVADRADPVPVGPPRGRDLPHGGRRRRLGGADGHDHVPSVAGAQRRRRPSRRAAPRPRPAAGHGLRRRRARRRRGAGAPGRARLRRLPEDLGRPRRPHLRPDRAALDVHRRPPRRDRVRARARAAPPGPGDDEVVEGGARRAHLHRLQPERARPHDRLGLQRPAEAGRAGLRAGDVGRARRRRARGLHRRDDARALRRGRRPPRRDRRRRPLAAAAARHVRARTRRATCRIRPTTRRCRESRSASSPRATATARATERYGACGSFLAPRRVTGAEGGGTTGPMSPSGASSRSTITGA